MRAEKFIRAYKKKDETNNKELLVREFDFKEVSEGDLDMEAVNTFCECVWDDPEQAYFNGLVYGWDEKLFSIDANDLIKALSEYVENDDDAPFYDHAKTLLKQLEQFKGFTIYLYRKRRKR